MKKYLLKKYLMLIFFTVAIISWILIIPVGVGNSFVKVNALKARTADVVNTIDCSGTIEAAKKYQVTLGCQVKISKKYFNVGDKVKKGDRLLAVDKNVTLQALMYNAKSSKSSSAVNNSYSGISSDKTESALKQALSAGIISKSTYNNLLGKINQSSEVISSYGSGASSNQDTTESNAEKMLNIIDSSLRSPISGVITDITDGSAGISPAGTSLADIVDLSSIRVNAQVSGEDIKYVKAGQTATISGDSFNGTYTGVVKQIYPVATTSSDNSNMVEVIISINKPDKKLISGLSLNVTIKTSEQKGVVKLPYDSISQDDNGNEYVYVFKKGKALRRNIITGNEDDNDVVILKGVNPGETVIEDLNDTVYNGRNVRIN